MSLLSNNTEALKKTGILTKEEIKRFNYQKVNGRIVASLYNEDTEGALNILVKSNPAGIVAGLGVLVKATDAKGAVLIVNCDVNEQELTANAAIAGISLEIINEGFVNKNLYSEDYIVDFKELVNISEQLIGQSRKELVLIDDDVLKEEDEQTKVLDLVNGENLKGIFVDHEFYNISSLEGKTLKDLALKSCVIHTITDKDCVVDEVKKELLKLRKKSCGKCTFCREGLYQISTVFNDISEARGKETSLELAKEISSAMKISTNCSLGKAGSLPVLTSCNQFEGEIQEHINRKTCLSGKCLAMTKIYIDPSKCTGCGKCVEVCPKAAIEGKKGYIPVIDEFDCTKCGKCLEICEDCAIIKTSGRVPKLPDKPIRIKGMAKEEDNVEKPVRKSTKRKRVFAKLNKEEVQEENVVQEQKKVEVNIMKTLETDLVVVAAGPAGLAAAIAAGEKGVKTIVIEKSSATGGAANMGMGPLGIDTKVQRAAFNNISVEDALKMHMEYTHYRVDEDLVQTYFNKSADTIEWLEDMGVKFAGAFRYFKESEATWHIVMPDNGVIGPRAAGAMVRKMTERAKELGSEILLETAGVSLITEDGKVCGVKAIDKDGNGIEIKAKAVIVATGGFGNNKKMIKEEFGLTIGEDYFPFAIPGIDGDGLNMMWEVGAEKYGQNIEAIYQLPDNLNWFLLDAVLRQPNLLINQFGDRFMDEGMMGNTTYTGNALRLQPGNYGYCIMDEGILREYKKNGPDIVDIVHPADAFIEFEGQAAKAVEQGYQAYFEADTIEELAEKLGIDADKLQDTIDTYNEMCECGVDSQFHKSQKFLHKITGKGKYLVGKYYLAAYGTIGGVRINKYCEVLDKNKMPIEGLYSAGTDANTIYGDSYNFTLPGNSMGFAVNTGRMAGESAADYILES